jgi:hypothetical protein
MDESRRAPGPVRPRRCAEPCGRTGVCARSMRGSWCRGHRPAARRPTSPQPTDTYRGNAGRPALGGERAGPGVRRALWPASVPGRGLVADRPDTDVATRSSRPGSTGRSARLRRQDSKHSREPRVDPDTAGRRAVRTYLADSVRSSLSARWSSELRPEDRSPDSPRSRISACVRPARTPTSDSHCRCRRTG